MIWAAWDHATTTDGPVHVSGSRENQTEIATVSTHRSSYQSAL